eukprot:CAMPEP_0195073116 /NCGR_PEP_ID=MMETSP0448-20130528/16522_1 /TAXON_ID=66468 /ORGANISM="Heterocapsa triquestra, Strain CCMP 448" /LENGTH=51 /DNA_ID=CAMNT_0040105185 /DNA_START=301 /DNA_END=454 /DNA_ORIENTATION=+
MPSPGRGANGRLNATHPRVTWAPQAKGKGQARTLTGLGAGVAAIPAAAHRL